ADHHQRGEGAVLAGFGFLERHGAGFELARGDVDEHVGEAFVVEFGLVEAQDERDAGDQRRVDGVDAVTPHRHDQLQRAGQQDFSAHPVDFFAGGHAAQVPVGGCLVDGETGFGGGFFDGGDDRVGGGAPGLPAVPRGQPAGFDVDLVEQMGFVGRGESGVDVGDHHRVRVAQACGGPPVLAVDHRVSAVSVAGAAVGDVDDADRAPVPGGGYPLDSGHIEVALVGGVGEDFVDRDRGDEYFFLRFVVRGGKGGRGGGVAVEHR